MSPLMGNIVRSSVPSGCFPDILKKAVLHPKLKNADQDRRILEFSTPCEHCFLEQVYRKICCLIATLILMACFRHFYQLTATEKELYLSV